MLAQPREAQSSVPMRDFQGGTRPHRLAAWFNSIPHAMLQRLFTILGPCQLTTHE